jgi:hypothetical protein
MPLTPKEMAEMIEELKRLCEEAQELQKRISRAMVESARRDMPLHRPPGKTPKRR